MGFAEQSSVFFMSYRKWESAGGREVALDESKGLPAGVRRQP